MGNTYQASSRPVRDSLLSVRAAYFCYFAAVGIYATFINIYFRNLGLSGAQIGIINTLSPLMAMAAGPLFGFLNDRYRITRLLLAGAAAGTIISAIGLSTARSYGSILLFAAFLALFFPPIVPIVDSINLQLLGENRAQYGRQRFWGSIGFILTTFGFGFLLARVGVGYLFPGFAAMMLVTLVIFLRLPEVQLEPRPGIGTGILALLKNPEWVLFSLSLLLLGTASTGMVVFLGIYLIDLGGAESLVGSAFSIGTIVELPVMYFSVMLFRFLSARKMLALSFLFFSLRFLLYSILPAPEWVLAVNLIHGVSYGFYWIGSVAYVNELAPEGLKSTGQGLFLAVMNLATISGAMVGGLLFDSFGPVVLFRVYAGFALAALLIQLFGRAILARRTRPTLEKDSGQQHR